MKVEQIIELMETRILFHESVEHTKINISCKDGLFKILKEFNLGRFNANDLPIRFLSVSHYRSLLNNIYSTLNYFNGNNIPYDLSKILKAEHLFYFGYFNISKSPVDWGLLTLNFQIMDGRVVSTIDDIPIEYHWLIQPIAELGDEDIDSEFYHFLSRLLTSTFGIKFNVRTKGKYMWCSTTDRLIGILPLKTPKTQRFIEMIRMISVYLQLKG
jgi:hypothetical protein